MYFSGVQITCYVTYFSDNILYINDTNVLLQINIYKGLTIFFDLW